MFDTVLDYVRTLSATDKKTLSQKALKTAEEVGELAKVVLPYDGAATTAHRFVVRSQILEEVADIMLCALSVGYDLDFTHDEIAAEMMRKARYWDELQSREKSAVYPLPYEIHVTVAGGKVVDSAERLAAFKEKCAELSVKPLLIDMHDNMGKTVMLDCQTSSVHVGTNTSALEEMSRITGGLRDAGWEVSREKIETVPWHPAAPRYTDEATEIVMPKRCYFEAHLSIVTDTSNIQRLRSIADFYGAHLSRNAFKKLSDTKVVMMMTLRCHDKDREGFELECFYLKRDIEILDDAHKVGKTIIEFAIYDTNIDHDTAWTKAAA